MCLCTLNPHKEIDGGCFATIVLRQAVIRERWENLSVGNPQGNSIDFHPGRQYDIHQSVKPLYCATLKGEEHLKNSTLKGTIFG